MNGQDWFELAFFVGLSVALTVIGIAMRMGVLQ